MSDQNVPGSLSDPAYDKASEWNPNSKHQSVVPASLQAGTPLGTAPAPPPLLTT